MSPLIFKPFQPNFILSIVVIMDKKILLPGDYVGPGEVVRPGPAAHMEGDDVYSSTVGILNESESGVEAKKSKKLLGKGDTVLALVLNESDSFAILSAVTPEDTVAEEGKLLGSSVSREYVKSMRDAIRIGDIVFAKVAKRESGSVYFTISYPEYGVVKAFCTSCREPMEKTDRQGMLKCPSCGGVERRKVGKDYRSFGDIKL